MIPGLVDHHVHLMGLAASWTSVDCSPAALAGGGDLGTVLRAGRGRRADGWVRGIGYDVTHSGPLDRDRLDRLDRLVAGPVRVQDRTGIQWILDSRALAIVLPEDRRTWPDGVEVGADGRPTGRSCASTRGSANRWRRRAPRR